MVNKAPSASLFSSILLLILAFLFAMADSAPKSVASSSESAVHIVYTERPLENEEPEAYHIRTLASVLGSDEAAKGALIYSYKTAASGFSAKLTPQQNFLGFFRLYQAGHFNCIQDLGSCIRGTELNT